MDTKIVAIIDLFDREQKIYKISPSEQSLLGKYSLNDINSFAMEILHNCYNCKINDIHFFGQTNYIEEIVESINNVNRNNYSLNLNIEVN